MFEVAIRKLESEHRSAYTQINEDYQNRNLGSLSPNSAESILALLRAGAEVGRIVNITKGQPQVTSYSRMINAIWGVANSHSVVDYIGAALVTVLSFCDSNLRDRAQPLPELAETRREMAAVARSIFSDGSWLDHAPIRAAESLASAFKTASGYEPINDTPRYRNVWNYLEELQYFDFEPEVISNCMGTETELYLGLSSALESDIDAKYTFEEAGQQAVRLTETVCSSDGQQQNPFTRSAVSRTNPSDGASVAHYSARHPEMELAPTKLAEAPEYTVWYGTDRQPHRRGPSYGFLDTRDPAGRLHVGTCKVRVPESHRFGTVGRTWLSRWPSIDGGALSLQSILPLPDIDAFSYAMRVALNNVPADERTVVIYVHGYNSTFRESAIRAAQIGFDLRVPGAMAFFSWPSRGRILGYLADAATVDTSELRFAEFLETVVKNTGAAQVNLISHSMGNRLTARAMKAVHNAGVKLGKVILAAPDIDTQLFKNLAASYPLVSDKTTMYVSRKDLAVRMSRHLHRYPRAGFTPPITVVPNIDTIEVGDIDVTSIGHGYFAAAEPVLYDIKAIFDGNIHPHLRPRLSMVSSGNGAHWALRR